MCFSEKESWITFILGTLACLFIIRDYKNDHSMMMIAISTIYLLLMQIIDALYWKNINNYNKKEEIGKYAYAINILQPVVIGLIGIYYFGNESKYTRLGIMIIFINLFINFYLPEPSKHIKKSCGNNYCNLSYQWWKGEDAKYRAIIYHISWILLIYLFLPFDISKYVISYLLITYIISYYKYKESIASIWCWFAAIGPIILYVSKII